jgi:3-phosphoshikimate 1-carboxyvinyltransferase
MYCQSPFWPPLSRRLRKRARHPKQLKTQNSELKTNEVLPDLIEILPLDKPVRAEVTVPGSKSITNRALILAALAEGEVTLEGALWSEDTQIMVECLQQLGFRVRVQPDPDEFCNRAITVQGRGGEVPTGGTERQPVELFVGNAGTAARFLAAFVCLGQGVYRLHGVPRMHERPQAALFQALRELGYRVEAELGNDKLPVKIHGRADLLVSQDAQPRVPAGRVCAVSIEESSQFASALLLGAKAGGWKIEVTGENAEESPYVAMTSKMIEAFPHRGGKFQIEPDASSGSYFWAAAETAFDPSSWSHAASVVVSKWPKSGWQVDQHFFPRFFQLEMDSRLTSPTGAPPLPDEVRVKSLSRLSDLGDSIMTAIVMAPRFDRPTEFNDLGRLRLQECERVAALRTELARCGAKVVEEGDTLTVYPSGLHGAEIETYSDHRVAMCFAILGLKVPGIKLKNPACVKKTFPDFFQKLAAPPPKGLGATIRDGKSGRALTQEELFAD